MSDYCRSSLRFPSSTSRSTAFNLVNLPPLSAAKCTAPVSCARERKDFSLCITADACKQVRVRLLGGSGAELHSAPVAQGSYQFKDLLPGKYTVRVEAPHLCWSNEEIEATVGSDNVDNVNFKQTGYRVAVKASHELTLVRESMNIYNTRKYFASHGPSTTIVLSPERSICRRASLASVCQRPVQEG